MWPDAADDAEAVADVGEALAAAVAAAERRCEVGGSDGEVLVSGSSKGAKRAAGGGGSGDTGRAVAVVVVVAVAIGRREMGVK